MSPVPELMKTEQAANFIAVTPATLTTWRCTRKNRIPFVRIGRAVRYRRSDLLAYIERNTVDAEVSA